MSNMPKAAVTGSDDEETYDEWFSRRVDRAVAEANDPRTEWVPHDVVRRDWEQQHEEILAMGKKQK